MTERINLLPELTAGEPILNDLGAKAKDEGLTANCWGYDCYSETFAAEGGYALFPSHKHTNVGKRKSRNQGASPLEGYHQWEQELAANADRVRVESFTNAKGESENVIRVLGGVRGRYGGAAITEHFSSPVVWQENQVLKFISEFQIAPLEEEQEEISAALEKSGKARKSEDDEPTSIYANTELRGKLAWHPKDDPPEVLSFNVNTRDIYIKWWDRMVDGDPVQGRTKVKFDYEIQRGVWYRYAAILTGMAEPNVWDWEVRVSIAEDGDWRRVWTYHNSASPLIGIEEIKFYFIGNEHNLPRNQSGGIFRYVQPRAETWISEEVDEEF